MIPRPLLTEAVDEGDNASPYQAMLRAAHGEALSAALVQHLRPTGVMGTLVQMPLTEILQTLDFGKKTARVEVYFADRDGAVHVHDGQIVRADAQTMVGDVHEGEAAVIELCRPKDGFFRIHYERNTIDRNVQRPTTFVLLEALRHLDEAGADGPDTDHDGEHDDDDDGWGPMAPRSDNTNHHDGGLGGIVDGGDARRIAMTSSQPRIRMGMSVDVEYDDRIVELVLEDVGLDGAFLRSASPPPAGTLVHLRIPADPGMLELMGRVVIVSDASAAPKQSRVSGIHIAFEGLSPELTEQLSAVITQHGSRDPRRGTDSPSGVPREQVLGHVSEAAFLVAAGDLKGAQQVLLRAYELAPNDDGVRKRLRHVDEAIDAAAAHAFLEQAMKGGPQAVDLARRAAQLRPVRDVLLRSLTVFARAGVHDEVADVAEQLLELDQDDQGALRTLLDANVAMRRWPVAVRAAEALLRLNPDDVQVRLLAQKVSQLATRS
jgi:hypothetical protein